MDKSADTKCYDLAEAFIEDSPACPKETKKKESKIMELAVHIQDTIEEYLEDIESAEKGAE